MALIATNAAWAVHAFDQGLTLTYLNQSMEDTAGRLDQALAVLPVSAKPNVLQAEVIHAAQRPGAGSVPFEKDGFVWVEGLGMRFDAQGRLVAVTVSADNPVQ